MGSILERHYNNYLKYDILNYELYSIILKNYLKNKNGIKEISDDDLYEFARKEYLDRFTEGLKEEKNQEFKENLKGFTEEEMNKIPSLLGSLYVALKEISSTEKVNFDCMFSMSSFFEDYYKCLEKVIVGFEVKHMKSLDVKNEQNKLQFKLNE